MMMPERANPAASEAVLAELSYEDLPSFLKDSAQYFALGYLFLRAPDAGLKVGQEGAVELLLPVTGDRLRAWAQVTRRLPDGFILSVQGWEPDHAEQLWRFVAIAWPMLRESGFEQFKGRAPLPAARLNLRSLVHRPHVAQIEKGIGESLGGEAPPAEVASYLAEQRRIPMDPGPPSEDELTPMTPLHVPGGFDQEVEAWRPPLRRSSVTPDPFGGDGYPAHPAADALGATARRGGIPSAEVVSPRSVDPEPADRGAEARPTNGAGEALAHTAAATLDEELSGIYRLAPTSLAPPAETPEELGGIYRLTEGPREVIDAALASPAEEEAPFRRGPLPSGVVDAALAPSAEEAPFRRGPLPPGVGEPQEDNQLDAWAAGASIDDLDAWAAGESIDDLSAWAAGELAHDPDTWAAGRSTGGLGSWAEGEDVDDLDAWAAGRSTDDLDSWAEGENIDDLDAWASGGSVDDVATWAAGDPMDDLDAWAAGVHLEADAPPEPEPAPLPASYRMAQPRIREVFFSAISDVADDPFDSDPFDIADLDIEPPSGPTATPAIPAPPERAPVARATLRESQATSPAPPPRSAPTPRAPAARVVAQPARRLPARGQRWQLRRRGLALILADSLKEGRTGWLDVVSGSDARRLRIEGGAVVQIEQRPRPDIRLLAAAAVGLNIPAPLFAELGDMLSHEDRPEARLLELGRVEAGTASRLLSRRLSLQLSRAIEEGWAGDALLELDDRPLGSLSPVLPSPAVPLPRLIWHGLRTHAERSGAERLVRFLSDIRQGDALWRPDHGFPLAEISPREGEVAILSALEARGVDGIDDALTEAASEVDVAAAVWCLVQLRILYVPRAGA